VVIDLEKSASNNVCNRLMTLSQAWLRHLSKTL
jgi:hypothetical protein